MRQGLTIRAGAACALALVVATLSAGSAFADDPWPSDGQSPYNTRNLLKNAPLSSKATTGLTAIWKRTFDSPVVGTPIVSTNGGVYVATENGEVTGVVQTTGAKYWEQYVGRRIEGSLLKVGNLVYVVTTDTGGAYLVALDAFTGDVQWRSLLDPNPGADSCGGPQYSATHNAVIVGLGACLAQRANKATNVRGSLSSVDATTGAVNWHTTTVAAPATGGGISGTPIVWDAGDKAFVTTGAATGPIPDSHTDAFLRFNLTTGAIDGQFQIHPGDTTSNSSLDLGKRVGFTAAPLAFTARDHRAYMGAGAGDGSFWIIDPLTMTSPTHTQLAAGQGVAGIPAAAAWDVLSQQIDGVTADPAVYFALAPSNGGIDWAFPALDTLHSGPLSVGDLTVWSTDTDGFLDITDSTNGHPLGRYPLGQPSVGGVSFYKRTAYVAVGLPAYSVPQPTGGSDSTIDTGALIAYK
jgi:outer membrane protein assembly factor BamB